MWPPWATQSLVNLLAPPDRPNSPTHRRNPLRLTGSFTGTCTDTVNPDDIDLDIEFLLRFLSD
jgi:hypothetical protein